MGVIQKSLLSSFQNCHNFGSTMFLDQETFESAYQGHLNEAHITIFEKDKNVHFQRVFPLIRRWWWWWWWNKTSVFNFKLRIRSVRIQFSSLKFRFEASSHMLQVSDFISDRQTKSQTEFIKGKDRVVVLVRVSILVLIAALVFWNLYLYLYLV